MALKLKRPKFPPESPLDAAKALLYYASSLGLAAILLIYLTVLTLLGTLNQVEDGLWDSVNKYFGSFFFSDNFFGVWIALPGGLLILSILFFNMLLGTIIRIAAKPKNILLFGVHFGILFLLLAGFVEMSYKTEGHMTLYPGLESNEYVSHHNWQLEILPIDEEGSAKEALVIPYEQFQRAKEGDPRTFFSEDLPFEIEINRYVRNGLVIPAGIPIAQQYSEDALGDWILVKQNDAKESEQNMPGIHAKFSPKDGEKGEAIETIIYSHWAQPLGNRFREPVPITLEFGGKKWGVQLTREKFKVPFVLRLDDFTVEMHPGTQAARLYQSDVTKTLEGSPDQEIEIKMNEPLRHGTYVFFQSSYGPPGRALQPGESYYSTFAVVKNPSDQWPKWACYFIAFTLSLHFVVRLVTSFARFGKAIAKASS